MPTATGIVVIDETAAVGLNLGVGGGLFLGGPRTTYSEETIGAATQLVHRQAIEELIARDKNHPVCRPVEPGQRARVPHRSRPGVLRAPVRGGQELRTRAVPSASST